MVINKLWLDKQIVVLYIYHRILLSHKKKQWLNLRIIRLSVRNKTESEVKVKGAQLCPTLCDPTDYTVRGILQARILEWVTVPFSRGPSQPRDQTHVSCIAGRFLTSWATREAQESAYKPPYSESTPQWLLNGLLISSDQSRYHNPLTHFPNCHSQYTMCICHFSTQLMFHLFRT